MPDALAGATSAARAKAARRASAVARSQALIAAGLSPFQADTAAAGEAGVQRAAVMRWRMRARAAETPAALLGGAGTGRPATAWTTPGAEDAFRIWCRDYLRREQPGAVACWRRVQALARVRGWTLPCERMFRLRLRREVPPEEIVRLREGAIAALALFPAQVRTVAGMAPLDCVSGDGKRHDTFVALSNGRVVRPVVWYWQDVRTRRILGWHWGESESWDLVRMAFVRMVDEHGVPRAVVVDNTFAASARALAGTSSRRWKSDDEDVPGLFSALGITVIHTHLEREDDGRNYGWGQGKPVERAFRDLAESIERHPLCEGAYAGPAPTAKPANYGTATVPIETFLGVVATAVAEYNARDGRRTEAAGGRSFDATWDEEIQSTPVRTLTAEQRALVLLAVESTAVRPDGTFTLAAGKGTGLPRNRYQHDDLRLFGAAHLRPESRRVVVRFDPEDLHAGVHVFDAAGRHLCFAPCIHAVGFRDTEGARTHGRVRGRYRRALNQAARARAAMEDLQDIYGVEPVAAGPGARPKVVELVRPGRPAEGAGAAPGRDERMDRFARGAFRALNES